MGTLRDLQFALQLKIEELRQRDTLIDELELELDTKDELIRRLQEELDRYRATVSLPGPSTGSAACSFQTGGSHRSSRKTIICEPIILDPETLSALPHRSCEKSPETQRLIQTALLNNDLLKNLDEEAMDAITAIMHHTTVKEGCCVIQEGSSGAQAYILEEGRLEMTKDGVKLLTIEAGELFGEIALLYNYTHTCSISAQMDSKLWVMDRKSYKTIVIHGGVQRLAQSAELLSRLPFLQSLSEKVIEKMCELMEERHFTDGDCITRQGAAGDSLYIISKGQVKVTEKKPGRDEPRPLSEGQWFGERALWEDYIQTENVIAVGDVTCLVIKIGIFKDIIDGLAFDCHQDEVDSNNSDTESDMDVASLSSSTLSDFQIICGLAVGEFGHVDLVQLKTNIQRLFAMKVLTKRSIVKSAQREHLIREGRILKEIRCAFIVRLYKMFKDAECLYSLTEACLGGDLSDLLRYKGYLDECSTRFYTACVVEALTFLHCRGVVYRDVKPENVVLDEHGYAKLIGSKCVKNVEAGQRTWTFCGTLGYMSPEVILCKGHSTSSDMWSLGVLVFELLSGRLPFSSSDPEKILTSTIGGIDESDFPKTISKRASSLITELCRSNPAERLGSRRNGAKEIQKHKWFEGFNWHGLCKRTMAPPLIPKVKLPLEIGTCRFYSEDAAEQSTSWEDF